jgi:hypothetical protein
VLEAMFDLGDCQKCQLGTSDPTPLDGHGDYFASRATRILPIRLNFSTTIVHSFERTSGEAPGQGPCSERTVAIELGAIISTSGINPEASVRACTHESI